jgi:hypothetical protein
MVITNPSKADFVGWVEEKGIEQSDNIIEKGITYFATEAWAESLTHTSNYIIFSTYTMLMPDGQNMNFIGAFNNFLPLGHIELNSIVSSALKFLLFLVVAIILLRILRIQRQKRPDN